MSELQPRSAKAGDTYRTALGLRLLPVGSVIRTGPRTHPVYFCKVETDAWAYCDAEGGMRASAAHGALGTARLPFRSEQIWLPVVLVRVGAATVGAGR